MKKSIVVCVAGVFLMSNVSCDSLNNTNKTQRGAAIGVAAGAVLGGVLGNNLGKGGNTAMGAVIGGVVGGTVGGVIGNKMDKQARKIDEAIPGAEVERVGEGIVLVLGENSVRFQTSKATLTTEAKQNLDKLIPVFNEYADTDIKIYGYTDSTGKKEFNQTLSEKRAASVRAYLIGKGIAESRFEIQGMGINDPIATNETLEGRAQNRRVEFTITANQKMIQEAEKEVNSKK